MFLQGNLQNVFDALFHLGVIDPVLKMDWAEAMKNLSANDKQYAEAVRIANQFQFDASALANELKRFDEKTLGYLAMEVAREFADFHARENLH